jgi:monoamine oxidase
MYDVLIIGAGLSGLVAARTLFQAGMEIALLEARDRPGGKILPRNLAGGRGPFDLGPTWFWPDQVRVQQLANELKFLLIAATFIFETVLPVEIYTAMRKTQTWMGQAMKVVLVYDRSFWRDQGLSGLAISYSGPVQQWHDACSLAGSVAGLFGWIGSQSYSRRLPAADRKKAVIEQAVRIFGAEAGQPLDYAEQNWANENRTHHVPGQIVAEVESPAYGHPLLQPAQWKDRLFWTGSEVSPVSGGFLEGAIYMGQQMARRILQL